MSTVEEFESAQVDKTSANKRKRVLVIGMDAVTLDLVYPWVQEGKLPNLAKLMASGSYGKLESTIQPVSAPAWVSFMTGKYPGKHGLYDFVRRERDGYGVEVTNASMIEAETLFHLVSNHGKRVIAINVPYTYPPQPVNGVMVSGPFIAVSDERIVYPKSRAGEILNLVENYKVLPDYDATKTSPLTAYGKALLEGVEMRRRIALHLIKEDWDLFMVVFMETDPVQHHFWHCMTAVEQNHDCPRDMIQKVYQSVDKAVGDLLAAIDENTVIILLSDHGAGPLYKILNLNRWLADNHWLVFKKNNGKEINRWQNLFVAKAMRLYRKYINSDIRKSIRGWLGSAIFDRIKGNVETALFTNVIDWQNTRAYALGAGGNFYINLQGREPAGTVKLGPEYEEALHSLTSQLEDIRDPQTGEKLIRKVWHRNELYSGPHVDKAADLIIEWADYGYWGRGRYDVKNAPLFEEWNTMDFTDLFISGTHRRHGVIIINGSEVLSGVDIHNASIVDLTPTILACLDIPIPDDMDGQVLTHQFKENALRVQRTSALEQTGTEQKFTEEEADNITDRLRQLGYL